jgi:hypothetical protein
MAESAGAVLVFAGGAVEAVVYAVGVEQPVEVTQRRHRILEPASA